MAAPSASRAPGRPRSRRCGPSRRRRRGCLGSSTPSAAKPLKNWSRIQSPIWTQAGTRIHRDEEAKDDQRSDCCRAERGRCQPRAPRRWRRWRRPAGWCCSYRISDLGQPGGESANQVEEEIAGVAHHVLDVVAEDPEEEHVAADVEPAAVEEHRGAAACDQNGSGIVGGMIAAQLSIPAARRPRPG